MKGDEVVLRFIVVGLGGTGSYLLNNLVNYLCLFRKVNHEIILVDGDVLEKRNLLRQGFLGKDIGKNKAEALKERFEKIVPDNLNISYYNNFINSIADLEKIAGNEEDLVVISCVDNNMARFRLLLAQFKMFSDSKGKRRVIFIDAGNEEWHGQVLVNVLNKGKSVPVEYDNGNFIYTGKTKGHHIVTIFDDMDEWKNSLSRGEHEISCDVITEAAPQNIVTNMTSASGIVYMLNKVFTKGYENTRYQFNVKTGVQEEMSIGSNFNRLQDIVEYANGEGKKELIGVKEKEDVFWIQEEINNEPETSVNQPAIEITDTERYIREMELLGIDTEGLF